MKLKQETFGNENKKSEKLKKPQAEFDRLKTNSVLFFQIGLIMALLAAYTLLEMQFKVKSIDISYNDHFADDTVITVVDDFVIEKPKKVEKIVERKKTKPKQLKKIQVVKKNLEEKNVKDEFFKPKVPVEAKIIINTDSLDIEKPEERFNVITVEKVPVFPGCEKEKSRDEKLQCMSQKMSKFIQKKFDKNLAENLGLSGKQRITVLFKIDEHGNVTNLKARAPRDELENEAKRVVGKLPRMIPGKQGDKNVSVMYALPILFQVK